ncbi:MAG: hypothetical protein R2883_08600 [Caldisericia bacterium]
MPVDVNFEYNEHENILFAKLVGNMDTDEDAIEVFEKIKANADRIGKKCWFVSDVTELFPKSGPAIKYSKMSSSLHGTWHASISIVKSLIQKSGMKLVGTFRKEIVHVVSSREEALEVIEKLKSQQ